MKITQKQTFEPITITLETKEEALAFINIIDTAEQNRTSIPSQDYSKDEIDLAIRISNAFTNGDATL
ncbi:MAG: hypothetical protein PF440_07280 [Thiomicrorhabdus sp.]|jgi:hypothetical protein|nr:hypothetical protein [Thiomicrorhabdus sp.]